MFLWALFSRNGCFKCERSGNIYMIVLFFFALRGLGLGVRPQWGRLSASRIDASRLCRFAVIFYCNAMTDSGRPPPSAAARRPLGGRRGGFDFATRRLIPGVRPQWGRLSASRIDGSRLCRIAVMGGGVCVWLLICARKKRRPAGDFRWAAFAIFRRVNFAARLLYAAPRRGLTLGGLSAGVTAGAAGRGSLRAAFSTCIGSRFSRRSLPACRWRA